MKMEHPVGGDGGSRCRSFGVHDIEKNCADMEMGPWISALIRDCLQRAEFADDDFMGKKGNIVSIHELIQATAYYASTMGYSPTWEVSPSPAFDDFARRPPVYGAMLKKMDNWSTLSGGKKLAFVKREVRTKVCEKATRMCGKPSPLGAFGHEAGDMASIFRDTDYKRIVCNLHRLGKHSEENPRFYIHMVYRYYMNELHKHLADGDKVLRFPSMQKVMDVKLPVSCTESTPPEFRMFLRNARGNTVTTVTLPVPSKSRTSDVVYAYNFEEAVPWVPVMRSWIFDMFARLRSPDEPHLYRQLYPKYLVRGDGGCERENRMVVDALARSIEMTNLAQTLDGLQPVDTRKKQLLDGILSIDSSVADIFPRYNNHAFMTEGEQLRERIGFLLQDSVRGVFRHVAKKIPDFCSNVFSALPVAYDTMEVFSEYCDAKASMKYHRREEGEWRNFVISTRKVCCILHAWSRKAYVEQFVAEHESPEGYLRVFFDKNLG